MPHLDILSNARTLFLLMLYALELSLGVFAIVALFHIIDEYNSMLLVLNLLTFGVALVLYMKLRPTSETEKKTNRWEAEKRILVFSILTSLLMSILRATWQVLVSSENAENISPVNEQEFYFTYLAMAIFRGVFFVLMTERVIDLL